MRPDVLEDDVCVSFGPVFPVVDVIEFKDGSHFVSEGVLVEGVECLAVGVWRLGVRLNGRQWNLHGSFTQEKKKKR